MITAEQEKLIRAYYAELGLDAIIPHTFADALRILRGPLATTRVLSENSLFRHLAQLRGHRELLRPRYFDFDYLRVFPVFASLLRILAARRVAVYAVPPMGLIKSHRYSPLAQERIEKELNWKKLVEGLPATEKHWREIMGAKYSLDYVKSLMANGGVFKAGSTYIHHDSHSKYLNVTGGSRETPGQPKDWKRTLHVFGPCFVFGYVCEDTETLPARLQAEFTARGMTDVRVMNHGLGNADQIMELCRLCEDAVGFKEGDSVLLYSSWFKDGMGPAVARLGVHFRDFTEAWHELPASDHCFYDRSFHCNAEGTAYLAKLMAAWIAESDLKPLPPAPGEIEKAEADTLARFVKSQVDETVYDGIRSYVEGILAAHPPKPGEKRIGAITMNANPFTFGHRRLVEYAAARVDRLYVFVLTADRSLFSFEERYRAVSEGLADLGNVVVTRTSEVTGALATFPEYYLKDFIAPEKFDATNEGMVFGKYIARPLGITERFFGSEPRDPVTRRYNELMKETLPQYGIAMHEIPRFEAADGRAYSASLVRSLMEKGDWEELKTFVPESTYRMLKAHQEKRGIHA